MKGPNEEWQKHSESCHTRFSLSTLAWSLTSKVKGLISKTNFSCFYWTAPLPSYSVLVAATSSIWQLFVDTKQDRAIFQKLQIDNPEMVVALDYNPVDKRVYWSDTSANAIKRMSVSGVGGVDTLVWWADIFLFANGTTFKSPMLPLMRGLAFHDPLYYVMWNCIMLRLEDENSSGNRQYSIVYLTCLFISNPDAVYSYTKIQFM